MTTIVVIRTPDGVAIVADRLITGPNGEPNGERTKVCPAGPFALVCAVGCPLFSNSRGQVILDMPNDLVSILENDVLLTMDEVRAQFEEVLKSQAGTWFSKSLLISQLFVFRCAENTNEVELERFAVWSNAEGEIDVQTNACPAPGFDGQPLILGEGTSMMHQLKAENEVLQLCKTLHAEKCLPVDQALQLGYAIIRFVSRYSKSVGRCVDSFELTGAEWRQIDRARRI